jgi:hypothetical protein
MYTISKKSLLFYDKNIYISASIGNSYLVCFSMQWFAYKNLVFKPERYDTFVLNNLLQIITIYYLVFVVFQQVSHE